METGLALAVRKSTGRAWFVVALFVLVTLCASSVSVFAQLPSWSEGAAYHAYTGYSNYFYYGPATFSWSDSTGNGSTYSIFATDKGGSTWSTGAGFWSEVNEIRIAEDMYDWAVRTNGNPSKYATQVNDLCQGFIDKMANQQWFGDYPNKPWSGGGDPYNWHGTGYADTNFYPCGTGGGDRGHDDLMWAAMTFAKAYQISCESGTCVPGWLTAAEEQVNYVWTNAQLETNASGGGTDGTEVGLIQMPYDQYKTYSPPYSPNADAEVNLPFVIAADMLAHLTNGTTSTQYESEAQAVYKWSMDNLYSTTSSYATTCTTNSGVTCAEIYDSNNTASWSGGIYNGESGYWSSYTPSSSVSTYDFSMNYGTAIEAAVRMGDLTKAQYIANYLMYGMSNPNHPYAGTYSFNGKSYNILPNFWPSGTCGEGSGQDGSNGIGLRGVGYALNHNDLNATTLAWTQANLQAAWNNKNSDYVIWNDWKPGDVTGGSACSGGYTYNYWDESDAPAGFAIVPAPGPVQNSGLTNGGSGSITLTLPKASTGGNMLVVTLLGQATVTFTGPSGWNWAVASTGSDAKESVFYYPDCPSGITSATFTYTNSTFSRGAISEWTGVTQLDTSGSATGGSGSSLTVSSGSTTGSDDLAITEVTEWFTSPTTATLTPDSNWTNMTNNNASSVSGHVASDYQFGMSGTVSENETSNKSGASWVGVIVAFK